MAERALESEEFGFQGLDTPADYDEAAADGAACTSQPTTAAHMAASPPRPVPEELLATLDVAVARQRVAASPEPGRFGFSVRAAPLRGLLVVHQVEAAPDSSPTAQPLQPPHHHPVLLPGDRIVAVNGEAVSDAEAVLRLAADAQLVVLTVCRLRGVARENLLILGRLGFDLADAALALHVAGGHLRHAFLALLAGGFFPPDTADRGRDSAHAHQVRAFAVASAASMDEEDPHARSRHADDQLCPVCLEEPMGAAVAPCGHRFCLECSHTLHRRHGWCAVCRSPIRHILRTFP